MLPNSRLAKALVIAAILFCVAGALMFAAVAGGVLWLYPTLRRVDGASATLLNCQWTDKDGKVHGNGACLQSQALAITGSVRAGAGALAKAMPEITSSFKATASNTASETQQIIATTKSLEPVIQKAGAAVDGLTGEVNLLGRVTTRVDSLLANTDKNVNGEGGTLPLLNAQVSNIGQAVTALSGEKGLIPSLTKTVTDAGELITGPDVRDTLKNLDVASAEGAVSMKHLNGTMVHVETTAGYVENWAAPKKSSLAGIILGQIARNAGGPLVGALVSHFFPVRVAVKSLPNISINPQDQKQ